MRGQSGQEVKVTGADLVSVSGSHDYVRMRGIIPKYHIECDPRLHKGDMVTKLHRSTEYLMASCCHPDFVKRLVEMGKKVRLWHLHNGEEAYKGLTKIEPGAILVGGGGSIGLRGISVLMMMGYRRFIIHGMDCSFRGEFGEQSHAGGHTGKDPNRVEI